MSDEAFCYADLEGMDPAGALEFSNAMAALSCPGIARLEEARALLRQAERRSHRDFERE